MKEFIILESPDFAHSLEGMCFFVFGVALFSFCLRQKTDRVHSCGWLTVWSLALALHHWLLLIGLSVSWHPLTRFVPDAFFITGLIGLSEYLRRQISSLTSWGAALALYLTLFTACVVSLIEGRIYFEAVLQSVMMAFVVLGLVVTRPFRKSFHPLDGGLFLSFTGYCLLSWVNWQTGTIRHGYWVWLPVIFLFSAIWIFAVLTVFRHPLEHSDDTADMKRHRLFLRCTLAGFVSVCAVFWFLGCRVIELGDQREREHIKNRIITEAKSLGVVVRGIGERTFDGISWDDSYHQYRQLYVEMSQLAGISQYTQSLYLLKMKAGAPVVVIGSRGHVFGGRIVAAFENRVPSRIITDAFHSKNPTMALYPNSQGVVSSSLFVPIVERDGSVVYLLGVDLHMARIAGQVQRVRLYLFLLLLAFLAFWVLGFSFGFLLLLQKMDLQVQKNSLDRAMVRLNETQSQLKRSEETFRGILNNSPGAIFGFDRDQRLIFWNAGASRLYGYERSDVIDERNPVLSRTFTDVFGITQSDEMIDKVLSGETLSSEMTHRTRSGSVDVEMTLFPVRDVRGAILFGIGLVQDVSFHKRLERDLAKAHAELKAVFDGASRVAIIATDTQGIITVFNAGAENLLGYSASEVIGHHSLSLFLKDEIRVFEHFQAFKMPLCDSMETGAFDAARGSFFEQESVFVRKDGHNFFVDVTMTGLFGQRKELTGYLCVAIDLTHRKEAERALIESERKFKDMVESINIGIAQTTIEPQGHFLEVNPAMMAMFGAQTAVELLSSPVRDLYRDMTQRDHFVKELLEAGVVKNREVELRTLSGKNFWALATGVLRTDQSGRQICLESLQDITDLKKMELAIREERERLQRVATSIGAGLSLVNRDYEIVWVNETLEKWFGHLEVIRGRKCYDTYQFRPAVCPQCPTAKAFETGQMHSAEQRSVFPDGRVQDFLLICSPIKNEKGEVEQVLELTLDITDRKRVFELLEFERAFSRNVINSISDPLVVFDAQSRILVDANTAFLDKFGMSKDHAVGKKCQDVFTGVCDLCAVVDYQHIIELNQVIEMTHKHFGRDGRLMDIDVTLSSLRDEKGQIIGVIQILKDVTERKRMEEELRRYSETLESLVKERTLAFQKSELMFRKLFESTQDGIIVIDAQNGLIIDANPFFLSLLEVERASVQGLNYRQLPYVKDPKVFEQAFEELKDKISVYREDVVLYTSYWKEIIVEFRASVYYVEQSKIIQCHIRDITERKKLEQVKSEFVAMVSHELRTPLSAIKEGVEIVADGSQGSLRKSQRDCLNIALANINRLNRLIGDILDISKIQSDLLRVHMTAVEVDEVVDQVYGLIKIAMENRGMVLVTDVARDMPMVFADKDRLVQVLMNLLTNAIKFTREKSKVTLSCRAREDVAEFAVIDEGQGIAAEQIPNLFSRFVQLDSTLSRRAGGSGLGLYISKNLVEAMGGRIWVESQIGSGSAFRFTVPLYREIVS